MTVPPRSGRSSRAGRFDPGPGQARGRGLGSAVAAGLALLALVAGVPAVLLLLAGPVPVPATWPQRSDLTGAIGIEQVLTVLVVVAWLAWLQFVVCVVVEAVAALRGGGLAVPVPLSGPSQRLARTLVASLLLAGAVVGQVGVAYAAVPGSPRTAVAATAGAGAAAGSDDVMAISEAASSGRVATAPQQATARTSRQPSARQGAATGSGGATARRAAGGSHAVAVSAHSTTGLSKDERVLDGRKVYEVKAPAGRHHDSLWAISERHLGDGRRYQEIFRLNEGRTQPDGRTLHLARLIQPGWKLIMPEDAVGVQRYVAERPQSPHTSNPPDSTGPGATERSGGITPTPPAAGTPGSSAHATTTPGSTATPANTATAASTATPTNPATSAGTAPPAGTVTPARSATPAGSGTPASITTPSAAGSSAAAPIPGRPAAGSVGGSLAGRGATTPPPTPSPRPPAAGGATLPPVVPHRPSAAGTSRPVTAGIPTAGVGAPGVGIPKDAATPPQGTAVHTDRAGTQRPEVPSTAATARPTAGAAAPLGPTVGGQAERSQAGGHSLAIEPFAAELIAAGLLGAALLGTLIAIRRRRGGGGVPGPEATETEVLLRSGADADRGALLDLALRSLPRSCAAAGLPLPQAYGAVVDDDRLDLLLTMSSTPPPPWSSTDDGLRWRLTYVDAQHLVAEGDSAYPLLASVGRDPQGRDALVNLGAAAGPVAVVGNPAMATAVVRALALGLAGNPWSRGIEVLTADLPPALPAIAAGRLVPCADARDLTDQLEQGSGRMPRTGPIQILTGGPAPGRRPARVAVYGAAIDAATAGRLQAVVSRRADLAVLVTGELPGARWRLRVDDAGNLSCDELSLNVTANRLGDGSIERLHALFMSASTPGPRPGTGSDLPPDTDDLIETDDVTWAQAPVRVAILGDVEVRAPGTIEGGRLALAAEIVAYLALHPSGVHPTVLSSAIWPRGVTSDVRDGMLDQVRSWLGTDPDGSLRLRSGHDGRIRLSSEVPCDWNVLRTLVGRADQSADASRQRDLLVRALHLVRGPVVGGIVHGAYSWLPRTDLEQQSHDLIVAAADRLCRLCLAEADQVAVGRAAAAGLRAAPADQHLWRHILRAEHALGGPARLAAAIEPLRFALTTSGTDIEPETRALIEHLVGSAGAAPSPRSRTSR